MGSLGGHYSTDHTNSITLNNIFKPLCLMPSILALALASPSHLLNKCLFWGVGFTALNKTRKTLIPKEFIF